MSVAVMPDRPASPGKHHVPAAGRGASHALDFWPLAIFTDDRVRGTARGLSGEDVTILIHSDQVRGRFSLVQHHVPAAHRSLMLSHDESDIVLNVAAGDIEIMLDDERRQLTAGAFVAIPRATLFGWHNRSSTGTLLVATYLSSSLEPLLQAAQGCCDLDDLRHVAASFKIRIPRDQPGRGSVI